MTDPAPPPTTAPPTPAGRAAPVLEVADLQVTYASARGDVEAVRGVDLRIGPGEVVGLVGESGSGKSSICGALLGLLGAGASVRARTLALQGDDLRGLDQRGWQAVRGRRVALIPQQPMTALTPTVTVGRQLDWYLGPGAVEAHATALAGLGLDAVIERPGDLPASFSGGQLQRLVIAIATLGTTPALLLADEPTSTLDATVQATVLDVLVELRARLDLSMLYVSHDLAVVAQVCDRVGVMRSGELVELVPTAELFADPQHPYTQALVAALPTPGPGRASRSTDPRRTQAPPPSEGRIPPDPTRSPDPHRAQTPPPSEERSAPVLEVDRLYHYYGRRDRPGAPPSAAVVRAVDEVSVRVAAGRVLALVGESGSGKTTLARAVAGALTPTAGVIRLDGRELLPTRTLEERRLVQLVAQNPRTALNRRRTIHHALDQAQRVHGIGEGRADRADRAVEVLRRVGLTPDHLSRRPAGLSGGELSRAVLARSLLLSPRLLLLDEPTASLDAQVKQTVLDLLAELQQDLDLTLLVITHELPTARAIADTVAVMHRGRVVEQGPTEAVFTEPTDPYTRALLASVPADPRPVRRPAAAGP